MTKSLIFDPLQFGLPADLQSERFVIANVLIDGEQMSTARDLLAREDFSLSANGQIWGWLCKMHDAGSRIDHVTLSSALHGSGELESIGGLAYLLDLQDGMPRLSNLESWIQIIRQKAIKRRAILKCHETAIRLTETDDDAGEVFAETERALSDLNGQLSDGGGFRTPAEIVREAGGTDGYLARRRGSGIPTPFPTLNRMTGGFRPGDLVVIAGNTGAGKSAMGLSFASHFASRGHAGAIFSLEMDAEQINDRIICTRSRIDSQLIRRADSGLLNTDHRAIISRAVAAAGDLPIYISDRDRFTVPGMVAELRKLAAKEKLEFVIVDYIQLAQGVGRFDKRADEVASITRGLKRMAGELRVPVIALSQFNRDSAKTGREPELHDLRESGSIEQDATLVLMIHFTSMYDVNAGINEGSLKLLVRKQRNGPTGWIPLKFHAPSGSFYEEDYTP